MKQYKIGERITIKPNVVTPGLEPMAGKSGVVVSVNNSECEPTVNFRADNGRIWTAYLQDIADSEPYIFNQKTVDSLRIEGGNQRITREIAQRLVEIRENAQRDDDKNLREVSRLVREIRLLKKNIK